MAEPAPLTVLYVEDETDLRERIRIVLEMEYQTVLTACNGREALELFRRAAPDLVLCDIRMPVLDGLELTREIRKSSPETPVVLCTAFTETAYLLKAIELGVAAYLRKPLDVRELLETVNRAALPILQRRELERATCAEMLSLELLLGSSPAMQQAIRQARRIAQSDFSLVIQGETGVGKSHLAAVIHGLSRRREAPLVTVTVSALPEPLVESQLFGHVKGAFTGAVASTRGLFEEADGGTLFLDDVDCAPPAIQAKLLHAVERKQFYPVGATQPVRVDVRIIAASNRDLLQLVRQGAFREDLYYRLGETAVTLPPLRERGDDVLSLARRFLLETAGELDRTPPRLSPQAALLLARHPWKGNVRELKSVMKRAALFAGESIEPADLEALLDQGDRAASPLPRTLEEIKREAVLQALCATGGRKMEAARLLGLDYSSFKRMLERYGL